MKHYYLFLTILFSCIFPVFFVTAQVQGCTDPLSENYNPDATINDGSCTYASTTITSKSLLVLPNDVDETSGLIYWGDYVYTHNDSNDINLYGIDTTNGNIEVTHAITGATNTDWEELAQDEDYIYIGDFGNNANGNRTNLSILKISKQSILDNNPDVVYINFSYENQTDFSATGGNSTDFDCEAFIVGQNNIYLFTKQWVSQETSVYKLPKTAGNHTAELEATYDVDGLITGATYLEDEKLIALSGYSVTLQPFIYLLYDYNETDFFSGNKRKLLIAAPFNQIEGITTQNGNEYFVSNENFNQAPIPEVKQGLHYYDLSEYLDDYLQSVLLKDELFSNASVSVYPNPITDIIHIQLPNGLQAKTNYTITDVTGKVIYSGILALNDTTINVSQLQAGMYIVTLQQTTVQPFKIIKN
ncbi:T9SS type A sorting domain-containing protein [Flavobacterium litorale]|uniref:T9SS type A sorting domain-containing protein n=1 Tax=Flavobacterium litorale TaxID=2856519 RepID=A0ABX8V5Q3_9FLAO|nr:T9SS type A sorting domain-containing protein [Flavobacterium litorale]QYJ68163.1 T9SS type A sorting domain-containing protein [Flavobacterium litorale]